MTQYTSPSPSGTGEPGPRRTLRRARGERMLFGVCAGIGKFFAVDPTLVRVGFVLMGLIPPLGGTLLLAYIAMVVIVPEEDSQPAVGRAQVQDNLSGLRSELTGLAETIRARVTGEPSVGRPTTTIEPRKEAEPVGAHVGAPPIARAATPPHDAVRASASGEVRESERTGAQD